ncbi:MAG TPA: SpoVR family protein, partial [Woeseiaceae bacterium]|nr:SpoVR family protein [Woeseiaceae bacterium]
ICEAPTNEDRAFFPDLAGRDWLEALHHAMGDFKDESFILQFLSPAVIRGLKLFSIVDDDWEKEIEVTAIHDEPGYRRIREQLSDQYNLSKHEPNIQIHEVDLRGNRSITLKHIQHNRIPLDKEDAKSVMKHLHSLWRFDVHLESIQDDKVTASYVCDDESVRRVTGESTV